MNNILEFMVIVVVAVAGFTALYKIMPFKKYCATKPKFALFPKYIAVFDRPIGDIEKSLESLEFKKTNTGIYSRGKVYGDFSANAIKISVKIGAQESQIKVYASFFGILFDTGDIWQVTTDILNGQEP